MTPIRIAVLSDLHLEFHRDGGRAFLDAFQPEADVLVLAGDIGVFSRGPDLRDALTELAQRLPVVYVHGNHELYGTHVDLKAAWLEGLRRAAGPNLHILDGNTAEVCGRRFIGCTLWYPWTLEENYYRRGMSDYNVIDGFDSWVHAEHARHLHFLTQEIRAGDIVVTHHLPHELCIHRRFLHHPLNRFFLAADAAPLVERGKAALWIHGHSHEPLDLVIGQTRVVRNPVGYPLEGVAFNPSFVVEV